MQARIARWIERKKALTTAEKLFNEDDEWIKKAIMSGLMDEFYDELSEEFDCPGVKWVRQETRRWGERHYPKELQDSIKAFKDNNECPPTFYWKAKLK